MKNLNKRFQQRHNDYLDTGKDKTSITKISCLGQTARNFINRLRQTYPNVNNAPGKEEVENFWRKIYGKKVQHNGEADWIKPVPTKSKHGSGAQYVQKMLQKH